jgi:murein DD-endopeptidase MepM/ murein hydrolase activator NlpD
MSDPRTFKLTSPLMDGGDIRGWRTTIRGTFEGWGIDYPLASGDTYDAATRAATSTLLYALGIAQSEMVDGVTPELRIKVRNRRLSAAERLRMAARVNWRRRLRSKYGRRGGVAPPVAKIIEDSWGYHPPVHDGLDVICHEKAPLYAMCDGEIIRADAGGWWGKGARPSAGHPVSEGDGVIVLRCGVDRGPFRRGLNIVYGHAEGPLVKAGTTVSAGRQIGHAGWANTPHIHLCVNGRDDDRGVGDRDPRPFLDYAVRNG